MLARLTALAFLLVSFVHGADWRNIENGWVIPDEGYTDQPYVVITKDGNWLCLLTTGRGVEGDHGQHITANISKDQGRTWATPIDIEPADGPEASWVSPLMVPSGRVYAIYTYNHQNVREVPNSGARWTKRVDTLGSFAFKYSDDNGRTWSKRYLIPTRGVRLDRENNFGGRIQMQWGVAYPIVHRGAAYYGFAKVSNWGGLAWAWDLSQSFFLRSPNIVKERDPEKIVWEMLPEGDEGMRAPKGSISEEVNAVGMNDGSLYSIRRTVDGYLCQAYSRDGGRTWGKPEYGVYSPRGRPLKHPRAAAFVWKASNGKYLLWYHNNGGEAIHQSRFSLSGHRNPAWIAGGVERSGHIYWSEPEILLYAPDLETKSISYPSLVEDKGRFFVTETQKTVARVHPIDRDLLEGMWSQGTNRNKVTSGLLLELTGDAVRSGRTFDMPKLASLKEGSGFAIDFRIRLRELCIGQTLLDTRDASGRGISIKMSDRWTWNLTVSDGKTTSSWDSDPGTHPGTLRVDDWQHVAVTVDSGSKVIVWVVDGVFNDGGAVRQYGWGRYNAAIGDVNGKASAVLAPKIVGDLKSFRIYGRYLRTSELVGNFRSGM
jgi:hypothetical protein